MGLHRNGRSRLRRAGRLRTAPIRSEARSTVPAARLGIAKSTTIVWEEPGSLLVRWSVETASRVPPWLFIRIIKKWLHHLNKTRGKC
jgi:hypothetical protein